MLVHHRSVARAARACLLLILILGAPVLAQERPERQVYERGHRMLAQIKRDLEQHYYDSTFRGVDLEARYRQYDARIDSAGNIVEMVAHISQFLLDLNDSHTFFLPPGLSARVEYGWTRQMIGDSCYVVLVKEDSDAEHKGLAVGDRVIAIDGIAPTRQNNWIIDYAYYALRPRRAMHLRVQKPDGSLQEFDVLARITRREQVIDLTRQEVIHEIIEQIESGSHYRYPVVEFGDTAMVWRLPSFGVPEGSIDELMGRARRHRALVLDLRDNGGGLVSTMLRLVGHFFDRDVIVATTRHRAAVDTLLARPARREPFRGMLVILVNSGSASASELSSRILQLEERAIIVGDRTAGAVMGARHYPHEVGGTDRVLQYRVSVTAFDAIMPDGGRLENRGVIPTDLVLPTQADLAAKRDPQMAHALELVGVTTTPEEAWRLYEQRRGR